MSVKLKNGIHGNTVCCGGMHDRLYTVFTSVNGVGSRKAGGEKYPIPPVYIVNGLCSSGHIVQAERLLVIGPEGFGWTRAP